jgi:hypothetical protein
VMGMGMIRDIQQKAAATAARLHKVPFVVWGEDLQAWKAKTPGTFPFPFLGDYVPQGWEKVNELFCDSSGVGQISELALTASQLVECLEEGKGYAVYEAGQFQAYIGVYERKEETASKAA